jgi:hypothetical protein
VKVFCAAVLTTVCLLLAGGTRAEAYVGFGYRANEAVRIDRCYRGLAWNYVVPFYVLNPKYSHSGKKCTTLYYRKKAVK